MNEELNNTSDDNGTTDRPRKNDDGMRLDVATRIFNVDAQLTSHFETVRMHFLGFVITVTGIVLVFAEKKAKAIDSAAIWFLVGFSVVALFASWRFSHAANFHWRLTAKMRQIIARHDKKVLKKYTQVSEAHTRKKPLSKLPTDVVWVLLTFSIPLFAAFLLWFVGG